MGKHLLDETAEFRLPTLGRHAAEDHSAGNRAEPTDRGDELEPTQRFDPGFSRSRRAPQPPRGNDADRR